MRGFWTSLLCYVAACLAVAVLPRLIFILIFVLIEIVPGFLHLIDEMTASEVASHFMATMQRMFVQVYLPVAMRIFIYSLPLAPVLFWAAERRWALRLWGVAATPFYAAAMFWFTADALAIWVLWFGEVEPLRFEVVFEPVLIVTAVAIVFFVFRASVTGAQRVVAGLAGRKL